jgi:hypothetical protein
MRFVEVPKNQYFGGGIEFTFTTNPYGEKRSDFYGKILCERFEELARLMIKVDPQAAIRAFGAAMQYVSVQAADTSNPKAA